MLVPIALTRINRILILQVLLQECVKEKAAPLRLILKKPITGFRSTS